MNQFDVSALLSAVTDMEDASDCHVRVETPGPHCSYQIEPPESPGASPVGDVSVSCFRTPPVQHTLEVD